MHGLVALQAFDQRISSVIYQTQAQDQALAVCVKKAVLLPHQRKLKAGDKVILIRAGPAPCSSSSAGSAASFEGLERIPAGSLGTVAEPSTAADPADEDVWTTRAAAVQFDGTDGAVQVTEGCRHHCCDSSQHRSC